MDRIAVVELVIAETSAVSGLPVHQLAESTRIDDLPIDSLQAIELTVALEDALGVEIGCCERISVETIGCYVGIACAKADARMPLAA